MFLLDVNFTCREQYAPWAIPAPPRQLLLKIEKSLSPVIVVLEMCKGIPLPALVTVTVVGEVMPISVCPALTPIGDTVAIAGTAAVTPGTWHLDRNYERRWERVRLNASSGRAIDDAESQRATFDEVAACRKMGDMLSSMVQLDRSVFRRKSANFGQHKFDIVFREV